MDRGSPNPSTGFRQKPRGANTTLLLTVDPTRPLQSTIAFYHIRVTAAVYCRVHLPAQNRPQKAVSLIEDSILYLFHAHMPPAR